MSKDNFYSSVFSAIPLPAVIIKANTPYFTIIEANTAYLELTGKTTKQLTGSRLSEIFPDLSDTPNSHDVKNLSTLLNQIIDTGKESSNNNQKYVVKSEDSGESKERFFNLKLTPLKNKNGEVEYIIQVVDEITEKIEAEDFLGKAYAIAGIGNWEYLVEEAEIKWSPVVKELHEVGSDYKPDLENAIHFYEEGWSRDTIKKAVDRAVQNQEPFNLELKIETAKGNMRWVRVVGNVEVKHGSTTRVYGSTQDIHERKVAEEEKNEALLKLEERIKEQNCLYQISILDEKAGSIEDLLKEAVKIIPGGFQYSDDAKAAIEWDHLVIKSDAYNETPWQIKAGSDKSAESPLVVKVNYLTEKPNSENGTFLREEKWLLDSIADQLSLKIEKISQQKELEERNEFIETALDKLPIGVAVNDHKTGDTTLLNKKFSEIYGWAREDISDVDSFFEKVYPDKAYRKEIKERVSKDIASGDPAKMEWYDIEITTKKGEKRYINAKNIPLIDQGLMISTVMDITAERESRDEKFKILESISDAFYGIDANWRFTYFNREAMNLLGKIARNVIGKNIWQVFPEAKNSELYSVYNRVAETEMKESVRYYYEPLDTWFDITAYPNNGGLSVYFRDINERIEKEKKMEELSLVASRTTELVIITDSENRITWVNKAFEHKTGYTLEECRGKIPGDLLHGPATSEKTKRRLTNLIQKQASAEEVILNYAKDGTTFWLEMKIDPIFNEEGECTHFIALERDVTDKIEKEKELRELLERYEIVSKATSDTIWDFDLRKDFMIYNRNIFTMFGYPHAEVQDMAGWWRDKIHPDDREIVNQKIRTVLAYGTERFQMEYRFRASDGSYKHIYDRAFLIKDRFGEPVRMIGAMQDVTQKVEEQEQLRLMDSVITNTNEAVMIVEAKPTDSDGRKILYVNDAFSRIMGYAKDEVTGHTLDVLNMHQTNQQEWMKMLKEMETSHSAEAEFVNVKKSGEKYWVYASIEWVGGSKGNQGFWVFIGRDITENKKQEHELRSSLQEKVILLSEIHHRVKNNLAIVSSLLEIQAMKSSNPDLSSRLLESVLRIKSMATIHEQLYQSKSFSELQFSEGIKQLIDNILKTLNSSVDIELTYNLEDVALSINQGVPCSLIINEVVTNILKHAYSGRKSGSIKTTVEQENDNIKLQICDDGNGLPENFGELKDESLGLQLIDLLTIQLGGEKVFSSTDKETCFTLTFPKINVKGIGSDFAHKGDPFY